MARWRLRTPHYLMVPGTKWQYKETSRETGEEALVDMIVPKYLDPNDPRHCNRDGDCIVTTEPTKPGMREFQYLGPPTPDMEPLDPEAQAITDAESPKWQHPIESLPESYSASLLSDLQRQLAQAVSKTAATPPVENSDLAELKKMVADLATKNAELEARISKAEPRRV